MSLIKHCAIWTIVVVMIAVLLSCTRGPVDPVQQYGDISGYVRGTGSQKAIDGAIVKLSDKTYYVSRSGIYIFSNVPEGYHVLEVEKAGFQPYSILIKVVDNGTPAVGTEVVIDTFKVAAGLKSKVTATEALNELEKYEPGLILGIDKEHSLMIDEISSLRRVVDERGIYSADVVFVPLEDGDRTIGLKKNNKKIITVDLNPMSRTSATADITIVDNIIRVFPLLEKEFLAINSKKQAIQILDNYDNESILKDALRVISTYWDTS